MNLTGSSEIQRLVGETLAVEPYARAQRVEEKVTAVVTVEQDMRYLPATLRAILSQTVLPGTVVIADCSGQTLQSVRTVVDVACAGAAPASLSVQIVKVAQARSFGDAVAKAVRNAQVDTSSRTLWLLHDDSRPADDHCLESLLDAWNNTPTAAVLGAKQLDWEGEHLHNVGAYAYRHGLRTLVVDGEPDQQQYDGRQDVYAVSLAGALIPDHTLASVHGVNPWFTTYRESADFCRRLCLNGKRVVVVPSARIAHRRARYEGVRTADGKPLDDADAIDTSMPVLAASQKYFYTDFAAGWWPLAWILRLVVCLCDAVRQLFRKMPYRGWCMLCMPWIALFNIPGALTARHRMGQQTRVGRRDIGQLVADHHQIAAWKAATREYEDQRTQVLLSPLARAHLRRQRIRRWTYALLAALVAFAVVVAVYWQLFRTAWSADVSLYSDTLLPTGATWDQLVASATTPWVFGTTGTGIPAPPTPWLLVLMVVSAVTGGHVALAVTLLFFLAAPAMTLSFWALAGVVTRSNPVRVLGALAWFALALGTGMFAQADVAMLTVFVFMPAAFAFVFKAVGMYRTEQPVNPRASVQAAALAALLFMPVVAAEPQLLLALVVIFVAFLVFVRRHRMMLVLIPFPAAFALAPTIVNAIRYAGDGMWRQLFGDVTVPLASVDGTPAVRNLTAIVAAVFGMDTGGDDLLAAGWTSTDTVRVVLILVLLAVLAVVAIVALLRPSLFRASHILWTVIVCGILLAMVSGAVAVAASGTGSVAGSTMPGLSLAFAGLICCVCMMAGPAVKAFTPLTDRGARKFHGAAVGRLLISVALAAVTFLCACNGYANAELYGIGVSGSGLPMVAQQYLSQNPDRRVLALAAESNNTVAYTVMRTGRGDLIDSSAAQRVRIAFGNETNTENDELAAIAGKLLANADADAIQDLSDLGFGGIYVVAGNGDDISSKATDQLVANITSSTGTQSVVDNDDGVYYRLTLSSYADQKIDVGWQMRTQSSPWRAAWLWCLVIVTALYIVVAIPRRHTPTAAIDGTSDEGEEA
ncbi:glycosyltransferase family 2 protein [Bifidobacterium choloepi]|uniref:Glycosyltransferase n=1 Tax=Bifidobacterium choloepi TaxID=2614131 RepID=A0A6I5NCX2_9BIFI|nr:glycosyltransferase family 2 protein [Bifidobacterium choloepi]NEG69314.1 glycosyltransferase [Bifidobacterium choloepi]